MLNKVVYYAVDDIKFRSIFLKNKYNIIWAIFLNKIV